MRAKKANNKNQCQPIEWQRAKKALSKLQKAENYNGLLLLAVGFYTGFRIGDVLKLKYSDFAGNELTVTEQKTGKVRTTVIPTDLKKYVALCKKVLKKKDTDYLFTRLRFKSNKPITTAAAITRIRETLEFCGFSENNNGNLSAHTLRKTFALRYYELFSEQVGEYRALSALSRQLNHSNTDVTRRYICLDSQTVLTVFENFG